MNIVANNSESAITEAYEASKVGKHKDAVNMYRQALIMDPKSFTAWFGLGLTQYYMDLPYKALYCYQQADKLSKNNPAVLNNIGTCYDYLGFIKAGMRRYKQAIEICLDTKKASPVPFSNLVWRYVDLGKTNNAIFVADSFVRQFPNLSCAIDLRNELFAEINCSNVILLTNKGSWVRDA